MKLGQGRRQGAGVWDFPIYSAEEWEEGGCCDDGRERQCGAGIGWSGIP